MKLIIETKRGPEDDRTFIHELRHEREFGWDADANDYIEAIAAFMFAQTFAPETILQAMEAYVEESRGPEEDDV